MMDAFRRKLQTHGVSVAAPEIIAARFPAVLF